MKKFLSSLLCGLLLIGTAYAATISVSWTEATALQASGALAAAASDTDDIDLDTNGYDVVVVTVEIVFGGSPDDDVDIEILASTNSGTDDDTEAIAVGTIEETTSATKRMSFVIQGVPYIAVKVTNNDSTDNVTYESWYAGREWSST